MSSEELKKKILEKIKEGEVAMKPRWHFVLQGILAITGIVILSLGLLYILSFIVFALRQSGVMFAPLFGFRGVLTFLYSSPWLLVLLAIIFIIVLETLVRKYSFAYKKPLLYVLLGIVGISLFGTYTLAQTTMHKRIQEYAEKGHMPPVQMMYNQYAKPQLRDVHIGTIAEVTEEGFIIENRRGEELRVFIPKERVPRELLVEGEQVLIFGERTLEGVSAVGVRPLPEDVRFERPMKKGQLMPHPQVQGKWKRRGM